MDSHIDYAETPRRFNTRVNRSIDFTAAGIDEDALDSGASASAKADSTATNAMARCDAELSDGQSSNGQSPAQQQGASTLAEEVRQTRRRSDASRSMRRQCADAGMENTGFGNKVSKKRRNHSTSSTQQNAPEPVAPELLPAGAGVTRACGTISGTERPSDDSMTRGPVVADLAQALKNVLDEPAPLAAETRSESSDVSAMPTRQADLSGAVTAKTTAKTTGKPGRKVANGESTATGTNASAPVKLMQTEDKPLNRHLVAIGADRDQDAFVAIYEHFSGRVKSFLMGKGMNEDIAEELMQEIMLTVWRRAESYIPEKAAASTWIFTIARNRRIDYLRGNSRVEVELDDELLDIESDEKTLEQIAMDSQSSARLQAALDFLPKEQKQVVHLSYFRGQSHGDIAEWLQLPIGTVKSRIRLAMQNIRQRFEQDGSFVGESEAGSSE